MEPFLPAISSSFSLPARLDYPFLYLSLVGSYQVGYTRSHPNTEVKMLRACSVPLCSHRWERQVIYLLFFLFFLSLSDMISLSREISLYPYSITDTYLLVPDVCECCPWPVPFFFFPSLFSFSLFYQNLFICPHSFFYIERFHGVVGYHITFT